MWRSSIPRTSVAPGVDRRVVGAKRELVPGDRRQQPRFGLAPDVAEQRLVIDVAKLVLAQTHGQNAGAKGKL
jgi:hypothetical protein